MSTTGGEIRQRSAAVTFAMHRPSLRINSVSRFRSTAPCRAPADLLVSVSSSWYRSHGDLVVMCPKYASAWSSSSRLTIVRSG